MKEYLKKHYCKECEKEISYSSWKYGTGYCASCSKKGKRNPNFNNPKQLFGNKTSQWKGITTKCVDCEKILRDRRTRRCLKCAGSQRSLYLKKLFKNSENHPLFGVSKKESTKIKISNTLKGRFVGKKNPAYIHGQGNFPYPLKFNDILKLKIRERDNYTCQNCNMTEEEHLIVRGRVLDVHHIDYNKQNCKEDNLIALCMKCNLKANSNRDYWYAYYTYIMENYISNKIIMTSGSFDLLHIGHIAVFLKAKALGSYLIVAVSTDELIKSYKGISPVISYKDRVSVIKELKCVDKVVKQTKVVDITQFKRLKADLFVLGDDWKDNYTHKGINWLRDNNKIVWVPYTKRLSTSSIKEKIINNAVSILKSKYERK